VAWGTLHVARRAPSAWAAALGAGFAVWLGASLAAAQAEGSTPTRPPESAAPTAADAHRAQQAKILDPAEYGPAIYSGGQAELVAPVAGISSLLLGYDAVWMQIDLSLGFSVGENPEQGPFSNDAFVASLRLGFPVHRGTRADYALVVGLGGYLIEPPDQDSTLRGIFAGGGRFRVFMTPNVAVAATLGLVVGFGNGGSLVGLGARPLGAASVVYFFR
jgi:hypothetical protein